MKILVTGGAGYIGSHILKALSRHADYQVLTIDNLSTGHKEAVIYGDLAVIDLGDKEAVEKIFKHFKPDAVMHFAAYVEVEESVRNPIKYYRNNTINTINLNRNCTKIQC